MKWRYQPNAVRYENKLEEKNLINSKSNIKNQANVSYLWACEIFEDWDQV
jgi:hypothetical protein